MERINLLQREDLDLYERRKLAIEFKEFVDKYVNPEYRENFYQFINHILHKYRMEVHNNSDAGNSVDREDELAPTHVEWPLNCTHIKIAYNIWNARKSSFRNPLEIAQRLRQYYYEETGQLDGEYADNTNAFAAANFINTNTSDKGDNYEPLGKVEASEIVGPMEGQVFGRKLDLSKLGRDMSDEDEEPVKRYGQFRS